MFKIKVKIKIMLSDTPKIKDVGNSYDNCR